MVPSSLSHFTLFSFTRMHFQMTVHTTSLLERVLEQNMLEYQVPLMVHVHPKGNKKITREAK